MDDNLPLGFMLERTTRMIKLSFHHLFNSLNINITPEQWVVLDILKNEGVLSQKEIGEMSFKDAPSVSRLLNGLINKKYIEKYIDKIDKRISSVQLTEKGHELVDFLRPQVKELRLKGISEISKSEQKDFVEVLEKLFDNYKIK